MAKWSVVSNSSYYLRCLVSSAILLCFLIAWLLLVGERWDASLILLRSFSVLENIFFIAMHGAYYVAALLLFLSLYPPVKSPDIARRLSTLVIFILWLFVEGLGATFAKTIGDGANFFTVYYLLTQFNVVTGSFLWFQIIVVAIYVLMFGLIAWLIWGVCHERKFVKVKVASISLVLMSLNLVFWFTPWPKSLALSPFPYIVSTAFAKPNAAAFNNGFEYELNQHEGLFIEQRKYNLVLIVMESTKARALSVYDADLIRQTSFFDQLAEQSLLFEHAYAVLPFTIKALTALNCGVSPYFNYPILESRYGIPKGCLAQQLHQDYGYHTLFMQSATRYYGNMASLLQQFGVQEFIGAEDLDVEGFEYSPPFGYEDSVILAENARWLERVKAPFFAQYLTLGPHWPYTFYQEQDYVDYVQSEGHLYDLGEQYNHYLNAVYAQDQFLEQLIRQYKQAGLYDSTIFVFVADHGQSFGEHRHFQHANNLYQEGIHIPLMIHAPALVKQGQRIDALISQTDVRQLLENLLSGRELLDGVDNQQVFSACWYWRWCVARTDKRYKYIHNFEEAEDELYDLQNDAKERNNIARQYPEKVAQFRQQTLD